MAPDDFDCDVLVIGGGPAGSTAAALLAEAGHRVVVADKDRHPRFHIGESLLPANMPLFERMGIAEQVRAIGMEKWGAEFVSPWHDHTQTFHFADAWDKSVPYAYQVRRSEFDRILIDNAAARGATVLQGCRVREVDFLADGGGARVSATSDDGTTHAWKARWIIDASGRDTFLSRRKDTKQRNPHHNSAALYAHFSGARRHPGQAEGNITIFWFEHGWFWFIPLSDGSTSVGAVTWPYYMKTREGRTLEQFLNDTIALCPALAARLADATMINAAEGTGNFSYTSEHTHGGPENYLLVGDAYAFIDPVFSSGVWLAMRGACAAADTVSACLREPAARATHLASYDRMARHGPHHFSWFIYRITTPAMRKLFMGPRNVLRMKEALLSVLAGDIYGRTPIWHSLRAFKLLYYITALTGWRENLAAWRRRRRNVRVVDEHAGQGA